MKIGAYQFAVTGDMKYNFEMIKKAIHRASDEKVKLLVFPECALTGYPPRAIDRPSRVDFDELAVIREQLQHMAAENDMHIIVGSVTKDDGKYYNSAILFSPDQEKLIYHKRALWGWDYNFCAGNYSGVFELEGFKIGIRICFEVRFPEYFRELYTQHTDLNLILFYDVGDYDDMEKYDLIKAHIRTRAAENVCHTLSVNAIQPYQTAPTALFNKSGHVLAELERNLEGLLIYDLIKTPDSFGEQGRRAISDRLVQAAIQNKECQPC